MMRHQVCFTIVAFGGVAILPTALAIADAPASVEGTAPIWIESMGMRSTASSMLLEASAGGAFVELDGDGVDWYRITRQYGVMDNGVIAGTQPIAPDKVELIDSFPSAKINVGARQGAALSLLAGPCQARLGVLTLDGTMEPASTRYPSARGSSWAARSYGLQPLPFPALAASFSADSVHCEAAQSVIMAGWSGKLVAGGASHDVEQEDPRERNLPGVGRVVEVEFHQFRMANPSSLAILDARSDWLAALETLQLEDAERLLATYISSDGDWGAHQLPNGTWEVRGPFSLIAAPQGDVGGRRISMDLSGSPSSIAVDGVPVSGLEGSAAATATAAVTLAALLALLYKSAPYVTPLLTRLPPGKALENENRKKLYTYICKKPGATFREVLRGTKVPAGTARHHLNVLARSDMIVERGHRSTLRYFENHGKFDETWADVVLLREPELKRVFSWFEDHPHAIQKEFLGEAESVWGWSRSTAQHRLARLVDGGIISFHQAGRRKAYFVVPREERQRRKPGLGWAVAN